MHNNKVCVAAGGMAPGFQLCAKHVLKAATAKQRQQYLFEVCTHCPPAQRVA